MKTLPAFLRDPAGFLAFVFRRWREDRCLQVAGSLTFTTLLALVPLFTVVVTVLSVLPFFEAVMVQIKIFLLLNLVPEIAGRIITVYMTQFAEAAARLTAVSLAALFAMTLAMLFTVDRSINAIWRADRHRPFWLSVAGYSLLIAVGPLLIGASLWATSWLVAASLDRVALPSRAESAILALVPVTVSAIAFFLVYRVFPNRHVPASHALAGGVLAAILFEAMKEVFTAWIRLVPTYRLVYGAFAAIPIFFLWVYLAWMVVLFGAEFTAALGYWRERLWRRPASAAGRLKGALAIVQALVAAEGRPRTVAALRLAVSLPGDRLEDLLDRLADAGVTRRERAGWRLARPLADITLGDLHRAAMAPETALAPEEWARCSPELGRLATAMEEALRRPVADGKERPPGEGSA